jgi:hypothetical protein
MTLDGELNALGGKVAQVEASATAHRDARQAERDARAQHEAQLHAVQTARQGLWARWDRMVKRWPETAGTAPTAEPSTLVLPSIVEMCEQQLDLARGEVREHTAQAARHALALEQVEAQLAEVEAELARPQDAPPSLLPREREQALRLLSRLDDSAAPVYDLVDITREAAPWADAIEALLARADALALIAIAIPIEQARAAVGDAVDWHAIVPNAAGGRASRGSVAAVLTTTTPSVRRYVDSVFGDCSLVQEPARTGDYLCPDGRYRLRDVAGRVRPPARSQALIGHARRAAAAVARRTELTQQRQQLLADAENARDMLTTARDAMSHAEARERSFGELLHMLEEVDQRRAELRQLRLAEEKLGLALREATTAAERAAENEETELARWREGIAAYPALADHARLPLARSTFAQAVADAISRAAETRGRFSQLQIRLRGAEESRGAEAEVYGVARNRLAQADEAVSEAQRLLDQARRALRAAGLDNVEARITQLQRRLKEAEEHARQRGVAKGVALHQTEAARQTRQTHGEVANESSSRLAERTQAFAALLAAVADSLDLPQSQLEDAARFARQVTKDRNSRSRLDDDLPRAFSAAEREQEGFVAAVGEYQALVGADDKFGLRAPGRHELTLAPQGWLLNVAPRMEGTGDVRILLSFLDTSIEQLQQTLAQRVTRVVRDIILGEVVSHLVDQLVRAHEIIVGLNERLATARFFARNTRFSLKLAVRLTRHPDIPFDHVAVATALLEHGRAMPAGVQAQLTTIFSTWLDEQMKGNTQPSVEALVEQLDYRRWVEISLLHADDLDPRVRPWDSAVSGFGSGGEQRVPVYVLLLTAAAMQFAVSNAPLRLLMHDEAFARMDQRNADLVVRFAQQLDVGLVIASPNLDLFAEGVKYATAYRLRQMPSGLIAREALHLKATPSEEEQGEQPASG